MRDGRVTEFVEKPADPPSNLVSMGVYVFSWPLLRDLLSADRPDFGRDILPWMVAADRGVYAYEFGGYWQDVGTVESYWATNLDLLGDDPGIELNDLGWLIYTKSEERPPARIGPSASVSRSMISHGCVIDGLVEHSVLSPGVRVAAGAEVRDSIVLFDAVIEEGAVLDRAIVDKEAHVGRRARVGVGDDLTPNRAEPERLTAGITLVGKRARIPRDVEIGRNARIDPGVIERDFGGADPRCLRRDRLRRIGRLVSEETPPIDHWLGELRLEVVAGTGEPGGPALSRDVVVDGRRRFDLRVTVAWVAGVGCSLWAYYGLEAMEIPKRVYARMLRANFDYPYVKFALTDDDRPMLMTELPTAALDRDELGRGLARLAIVADRLLDETANAVADRGLLPDWSGRTNRNPALLEAYGPDVESAMPAWEPSTPRARRRGWLSRVLGRA